MKKMWDTFEAKYIGVAILIVMVALFAVNAYAGAIHAFTNVTGSESAKTYIIHPRKVRTLAAHVVFGNATGAVDFYQSANDGANYTKFKTYSTSAQDGVYDIKTQAPGATDVKAVYRDKDTAGTKNPANLWINYEKD